VTIKVSGKPQILGTCSPQTPESFNLKFDLDDYVGHVSLTAKNGKSQPSRVGRVKGWNIMIKNGFFLYFFCQALENTFWGGSSYFLHWMTCFGGDLFP